MSTVTCQTCSASSDSQQSCWVLTLPIQAAVLDPKATVSSAHAYGAKDKPKDKAVPVKEKSTRMSAKEKKAKLKAEKRAERQKRKGRNSHTSTAPDEDGSGMHRIRSCLPRSDDDSVTLGIVHSKLSFGYAEPWVCARAEHACCVTRWQ